MSSHHIVRENQEPALIIASMDALDSEGLGQLLEWSPTIIANDYTVDFLLAEDIKVDVVFSEKQAIYAQEQIQHFPLKAGFLRDALSHLIETNHKAVNIISDTLDEELLSFCAAINIVLLTPGRRTVFVQQHYEKWMVKGRRIYVDERAIVTTAGLQQLDHGLFETLADGFFRLALRGNEFIAIGEDL